MTRRGLVVALVLAAALGACERVIDLSRRGGTDAHESNDGGSGDGSDGGGGSGADAGFDDGGGSPDV